MCENSRAILLKAEYRRNNYVSFIDKAAAVRKIVSSMYRRTLLVNLSFPAMLLL